MRSEGKQLRLRDRSARLIDEPRPVATDSFKPAKRRFLSSCVGSNGTFIRNTENPRWDFLGDWSSG